MRGFGGHDTIITALGTGRRGGALDRGGGMLSMVALGGRGGKGGSRGLKAGDGAGLATRMAAIGGGVVVLGLGPGGEGIGVTGDL